MNLIIVSLNPADEIFLSKEISHLKDKFHVIFISRDREKYNNITIESGEGIKSYVIDDPHARKINWIMNLFFSLFKLEVWKELIYLITRKSFSFITVKKLLFYSASTAIDSKKIIGIMRENNLSYKEQILLYSYRMNTGALTIIKTKKYYKGAKCIARAHGVDLYEYRHEKNYIPFRRKILKGLTTLYCISTDGKNYVDRYPFDHCKVEVSRLGTVDYGIELASAPTVAENKPVIVSCSRISPEKRIKKIVDALSMIDEEIHWVHIGGGDMLDELKMYAKEKLSGKTKVSYDLVGNMGNNEVTRFYGAHYIDGFVNVSSVEGIPVSIMEACSFGIPIIATDVGGTGEIVKDNYNGYLLPVDFSDKLLSSTIAALLKNKSKTEQLRKNARVEWEDHYNEDWNYQLFANSLLDL